MSVSISRDAFKMCELEVEILVLKWKYQMMAKREYFHAQKLMGHALMERMKNVKILTKKIQCVTNDFLDLN